jgi:diaminohydroxyphosphoribosylaminopyrimidine deaminase / 5-amino-6-(5-phosphoribosylamino)uracil reductase
MSRDHTTEAEAWSEIRAALPGGAGVHPRADGTAGKYGIRFLPDSSWACDGPVCDAARTLLEIFAPLVSRGDGLVIGQLGQSLDGRIATDNGASHYINGEAARVHLHRLRAIVDAVVIGVGTLNADNPQLTVRHVEGRNPVRVLLDPEGRANPRSRVFHDGQAGVVHVSAYRAGAGVARTPAGVETLVLPRHAQYGFDPATLLQALAARGLGRVLVEGGGLTVSRFLQAGVLHRLHLMVAPMLIGSGRPGVCLPPITSLDAALRPRCRVFACGADSLFDLALDGAAGPVSTSAGLA